MLVICVLWQDVTDLFGTDLPVEGGKGGEFAWRDGPLLAALKAGHWVVLDEVDLFFLNFFPHLCLYIFNYLLKFYTKHCCSLLSES